jgi:hypothetical protein
VFVVAVAVVVVVAVAVAVAVAVVVAVVVVVVVVDVDVDVDVVVVVVDVDDDVDVVVVPNTLLEVVEVEELRGERECLNLWKDILDWIINPDYCCQHDLHLHLVVHDHPHLVVQVQCPKMDFGSVEGVKGFVYCVYFWGLLIQMIECRQEL